MRRRRELAGWVGLCAAAESVGMTGAAGAARLADTLLSEPSAWRVTLAWSAVVGAGMVEAFALGLAEATNLRRGLPELRAARFVLVTVLVAGATWAAASVPGLTDVTDTSRAAPSTGLMLLAGAGLGVVAGALLGSVQALLLPRPGEASRTAPLRGVWVRANIAAWAPAMAIIMVGASTPGAGWPIGTVLAWAALVGCCAGAVLGLLLAVLSPSRRRAGSRLVLGLLAVGVPSRLRRSVLGIRTTGRRTGRVVTLPVMYAADPDGSTWVAVGNAAAKTWWRNLPERPEVAVLRDGRWTPARAEVVRSSDPRFGPGLATYLARWPRARLQRGDVLVQLTYDDRGRATVPARSRPHGVRGG
jgi:hypothetical protein